MMSENSSQNPLRLVFQRERRRGDLVFAVAFLAFAVFLLWHLDDQVTWAKRKSVFAQPAFWPTVSIVAMVFFGALHYLGSVLSPRIRGRLAEVGLWFRSVEYCVWFMLYVAVTPIIGYLLATLCFTTGLTFRLGYRDRRSLVLAALIGFGVVLLFKTALQVKIPSGMIYEYLPSAWRSFMITYF